MENTEDRIKDLEECVKRLEEEFDAIANKEKTDPYVVAVQLTFMVDKLFTERDDLKDMESFYKAELEHAKEQRDEALKLNAELKNKLEKLKRV